MKKILLSFLFFQLLTNTLSAQIITTIAGGGGSLGDGGLATDCQLDEPNAVAIDASGNMFIADGGHNRIRKINTSGIVSTFAGTGVAGYSGDGGPAAAAQLNYPTGIKFDQSGNLYVADDYNHVIRKINTSGNITTIAGNGTSGFSGDGGPATDAEISSVGDLCVDAGGNIYFTDLVNNRVRKISPSGIISTVVGNGTSSSTGDGGPAVNASLNGLFGIAVDNIANLYITEHAGNRIRKVNSAGVISTIGGNGSATTTGDGGAATDAGLQYPIGVSVDVNGNVYVTTMVFVRKINSAGIISTIAGGGSGALGDGGPAVEANLNSPGLLMVDNPGNIYISDWGHDRIRKVFDPLAVETATAEQAYVEISPNPNTGDFTVRIPTNTSTHGTANLYDIAGRSITTSQFDPHNEASFHLSVPSGLYILNIVTDGRSVVERIVIR
jgi:sugar lactone lactonase YvrE